MWLNYTSADVVNLSLTKEAVDKDVSYLDVAPIVKFSGAKLVPPSYADENDVKKLLVKIIRNNCLRPKLFSNDYLRFISRILLIMMITEI